MECSVYSMRCSKGLYSLEPIRSVPESRRCVISVDGDRIVLPMELDVGSRTMAHDDIMDMNEMFVPFTTEQIARMLEAYYRGVSWTMDDARILDFLGCDKLLNNLIGQIELCDDDWDQIACHGMCLEARLIGVRIDEEASIRFFNDEYTHYLGCFRADQDYTALRRLAQCGRPVTLIHSFIRSDACLSLPMMRHASFNDVFWIYTDLSLPCGTLNTVNDMWIYVSGEGGLKIEGRRRKEPPQGSEGDLEQFMIDQTLLPNVVIPNELQHLTASLTINDNGTPRMRDDFFGHVVVHMGPGRIKYYPNAKSIKVVMNRASKLNLSLTDAGECTLKLCDKGNGHSKAFRDLLIDRA